MGPGLISRADHSVWSALEGTMPYRRYYRRFRRRYSNYKKCNVSTRGFLGMRTKFFDCAYSGTLNKAVSMSGNEFDNTVIPVSPAVGAKFCMFAPKQGNGPSNREGNQAKMTYISLQASIANAAHTAVPLYDTSSVINFAVVLDRQTNGTQLSSENVFKLLGDVATPFRNLEYRSRFPILHHTRFVFRPNSFGSALNQVVPVTRKRWTWKKKLNQVVNFVGDTLDVASIQDNSLHVVAWTTVGPPFDIYCEYSARIHFVG